MSISNNGNNNNNASEKLKEALLSEPLFSALSVLSRTAASSGSVASQSEMLLTMKQLASQMLEIAQQI